MTIKSSQTLVAEALKEINTISTDEAYEKFTKNECNLIDIRCKRIRKRRKNRRFKSYS